ncbi:MAG: hypothetical protein U0793_19430 [Gemmataceae bacterium]
MANGNGSKDRSIRSLIGESMQYARDKLCRFWRWIWPPDVRLREHPDYVAAKKYNESFELEADPSQYGWVHAYAKAEYDRLEKRFDILDEKADSIIKYLGGGTALIAIGSLATLTRENAIMPLFLIPSVLCALVAVVFAVSARNPTDTDQPPPVRGAVLYVSSYGDKSEAMFLGQWNQACEGMARAIHTKADKIQRASVWYMAALAFLLLPVVAVPVTKMTTNPVSTSSRQVNTIAR